jgi:hypothetical protein
MGARAEEYAAQFKAANQRMIDTVESMTGEEWKKTTAEEGWPAGVCAHHAAESTGPVSGLIQMLATTGQLPPFSIDDLNAGNAEHAQRAANCTKEETLALLRSGEAPTVAILRGISDEQFERKAVLGPIGEVTAGQLAELILIGHLDTHRASLT